MSGFQKELNTLRSKVDNNLAPPFLKLLRQSTRDLEQSGMHHRILPVGASVPKFTLPNQHDEQRALADYLGDGPLVVTFYRGFWCSYCNADLSNLQSYLDEMQGLGAKVIAISPQLPRFSKKIIRRKKIQFELLSDLHNDVAHLFGLRWKMSSQLIELFRDNLNINLRLYNGAEDWTLPIPARYVIDNHGSVVYAEAHPDYTRRPELDAALAAVKSLCS